jgi:hypothetical protein
MACTAKIARVLRGGIERKIEDVLGEDLKEEKDLGLQLGCAEY